MYNLDDYDYHLPQERIAQEPADRRDASRLMVLDRQNGGVSHHRFFDLMQFLDPSDVLVVNNTEVIPGRLIGRKETGGRVEVLILNYASPDGVGAKSRQPVFDCLLKASKRTRPGARLFFDEGLTARVVGVQHNVVRLAFEHDGDFEKLLYRIGKTPLPPYIRREPGPLDSDAVNYQTVYASRKGAVAAPTAGFHFTGAMLASLRKKGVEIAEITLHIGYGTFLPVREADIRRHKMHRERFSVSAEAAAVISRARQEHRRIVAVGTTCVRTLEYAAGQAGGLTAGEGECDLFIYPGYRFCMVDAMITNFHLPKSTLLMLASAFAGRENILNAYKTAIDKGYRFYSYGDGMLIR